MSEDSGLPTDIEVGDAYALRTFKAEGGRLVSVTQRGGYWQDGKCEATCLRHPNDADHVVPVENCTCGVYAYWTVEELLDQYLESARHMVAVIRMEGTTTRARPGCGPMRRRSWRGGAPRTPLS